MNYKNILQNYTTTVVGNNRPFPIMMVGLTTENYGRGYQSCADGVVLL
jgi:hypothetical protein